MCLTKDLSSGCGDKCLIYNASKSCEGTEARGSRVLGQPIIWRLVILSQNRRKCPKSNSKHMLFLYSDPISGYHDDEPWGDLLYRKIIQKFIIRGLMNISDQGALMSPNKKVYPCLEYHINIIIWVAKFLDFSLNNPQFLRHIWSFYKLFLSFTLLLTSCENNN